MALPSCTDSLAVQLSLVVLCDYQCFDLQYHGLSTLFLPTLVPYFKGSIMKKSLVCSHTCFARFSLLVAAAARQMTLAPRDLLHQKGTENQHQYCTKKVRKSLEEKRWLLKEGRQLWMLWRPIRSKEKDGFITSIDGHAQDEARASTGCLRSTEKWLLGSQSNHCQGWASWNSPRSLSAINLVKESDA